MLNRRKPEMQKLSFPKVWHFQSPHILTTLNSETREQEAPEVPSVSLTRRTAEEPCCCLWEGWQKSQEPWPVARNVLLVLLSCLIYSPTKAAGLLPGLSLRITRSEPPQRVGFLILFLFILNLKNHRIHYMVLKKFSISFVHQVYVTLHCQN